VRTFRTAKETIRTGEAGAMAAVGMPGAMRAGERRTERRQRPETYFCKFDAFSSYIQFPFNCVFWLVSCPSLLTTPRPLAALYVSYTAATPPSRGWGTNHFLDRIKSGVRIVAQSQQQQQQLLRCVWAAGVT